jgi:hypothetical protein
VSGRWHGNDYSPGRIQRLIRSEQCTSLAFHRLAALPLSLPVMTSAREVPHLLTRTIHLVSSVARFNLKASAEIRGHRHVLLLWWRIHNTPLYRFKGTHFPPHLPSRDLESRIAGPTRSGVSQKVAMEWQSAFRPCFRKRLRFIEGITGLLSGFEDP